MAARRTLELTRAGLRAIFAMAALAACTPAPVSAPAPSRPREDYAHAIGPEPATFAEAHAGAIGRRDTLSAALARFQVGAAEVDELVRALGGVFDVRKMRVGHTFELRKDQDGRVAWFRYVASPTTIALAFRGSDGALRGLAEPVALKVTTELVEGTIESSLYGAMDAAGEEPALTLAFVDLFAWDVDFFTETQPGDHFRILVEKRWVDGQLVGYGRVLGAEYAMASGRTHRAFFYERPDAPVPAPSTDGAPAPERGGYYTEEGQSVRKAFLKSPIQFSSITSRFGLRRHPILEYVGTHKGVDYAAPIGTSVWAVGDGVVRTAGRAGGYGNMVSIQHANGLETRYAHLKGFGPGISAGKRVSQKQVVGYVGMTGLTTGPHLHFEVLRQGRWMNPLSVAVPPAPPIPAEELEPFRRAIAPIVARLLGDRALAAAPTKTATTAVR
ncbi:M23 family metallopeptidase [Myxococcota bacterium]|nr:M23 family metallopeptidase [Myxococcota bacterium]